MSIIVRTNRLLLREVEEQDLAVLSKIYADRECMQFYPSLKSPAETRTWFQELSFDSYREHGFGLWAAVELSSGEVIGDCGITLQETPEGFEPEIGYHLWRDYWGRGFATEAAKACRAHALNSLGFDRVVSITSPQNVLSQKVAEKVHDRMEVYQKRLHGCGRTVDRYLYISQAK
ncbi:GNAT family N-acetyltransferase [Rhizobium sp. XQZ8]|uniref:GNAT family N-acetyltransferase n=1 Tax=Rhizobium populisoli TaxID=2859785 RepID=UPI001C66CF94|nr:GNAT family N-acetyltransferase [Rhizobium populisoli]MBW6425888.1 GNAT family N-acetyltransferase [Rhizobium populisoli]